MITEALSQQADTCVCKMLSICSRAD